MKRLGIIDLGSGNRYAVENVLRRINIDYTLVKSREEISDCSHVILPGVGAFDDYIARMKDAGIFDTLANFHSSNIFLLGICIGMHVLADSSDEGRQKGLGLISGNVERLDTTMKLPHMGWNSIVSGDSIFDGVDLNKGYYFLHNYHFKSLDVESSIAFCDYGGEINCVVKNKKVYGVQFHPEKSHINGELLFRNFMRLEN